LDAFFDAGISTASLPSPDDVLAHEITIFRDRVRIDFQTKKTGLVFSET
jgi:hypothetical protein